MVTLNMPLPDDVHRRVKAAAALRGQSVQAYVTQVLDEATADLEDAERRRREPGEMESTVAALVT